MSPQTEKLDLPRRYRTFFQVEGTGPFPLDMLRYDSATFATETDAGAAGRADEPRIVSLITFHHDKTPRLGVDRWRSFGWRVCP